MTFKCKSVDQEQIKPPTSHKSRLKDFYKQQIGVFDPAESKSGLISELSILLLSHFAFFCQTLEKESNKPVGHIVSQTRPCCRCLRTCIPCFTDSVYLSSGPTVMFRFRSDALGNAKGFSFNITTEGDRKSTRLNSSHQIISYAVFCLKKKKKQKLKWQPSRPIADCT